MHTILSVLVIFVSLIQAQKVISKRGLAYGQFANASDNDIWNAQASSVPTWYYNFNIHPSNGLDQYKMQFVPGNGGNDLNFYNEVKAMIDNGMNISYVLGFNEPDICYGGGSCIDAVTAAEAWKQHIEPLKKHGVKLGGPSVTGGDTTWLQEFYTACDAGCTTDFLPLHYYSDAIGLEEWVRKMNNLYKNMTIWVTEFACPNCSLSDAQEAFNQSVDFLDDQEYVTHYSYFGAFRSDKSNPFLGPDVSMLNDAGERPTLTLHLPNLGLTEIGVWYLGLPQFDVNKTNIGPKTPRPKSSGSNSIILANFDLTSTSVLWWFQMIVLVATLSILLGLK